MHEWRIGYFHTNTLPLKSWFSSPYIYTFYTDKIWCSNLGLCIRQKQSTMYIVEVIIIKHLCFRGMMFRIMTFVIDIKYYKQSASCRKYEGVEKEKGEVSKDCNFWVQSINVHRKQREPLSRPQSIVAAPRTYATNFLRFPLQVRHNMFFHVAFGDLKMISSDTDIFDSSGIIQSF